MQHVVHAQHLPSGSSLEACSGGGEDGGQTAPGVGNDAIMISTVNSEFTGSHLGHHQRIMQFTAAGEITPTMRQNDHRWCELLSTHLKFHWNQTTPGAVLSAWCRPRLDSWSMSSVCGCCQLR